MHIDKLKVALRGVPERRERCYPVKGILLIQNFRHIEMVLAVKQVAQ